MGKTKGKTKAKARRPRVLVLESLGGSSSCVTQEGGEVVEARPRDVDSTVHVIDGHDWDALLLTGGGDLDPRMYGQRPRREVYGVSESRDLVETYALHVARERDVPVMGICRGFQMINVEAGGTLRQHVTGHRGVDHRVLSTKGSLFRDWAGVSPSVVSLHHQRVERVAPGYAVTARAPDSTIEAIEDEARRVLGVQFHPEMDYREPYARGLFRWLVCEAATRAGLPRPRVGRRRVSAYPQSRHTSVSRDRSVIPALPAMSNMRRFFVCPHCGLEFEGATAQFDRDDHVAFLHDGMVTSDGKERVKAPRLPARPEAV